MLSTPIYIISHFNIFSKIGSSLSLPAHGRAGARATSLMAAHFAKRNTKFGGGGKKLESESEGGQKFLPPNPLPFCPPELKSFSKFSVRIFAKKSSDFVQRSEPNCMLRVYCLGASRLGSQIV